MASLINPEELGTLTGDLDLNDNDILNVGQILANAGSVSAPTYSVEGEPSSGMWLDGVGSLYLGTNGIQRGIINSGGLVLSAKVRVPDGSAVSPTYTFTTNPDTGLYRVGNGSMGFSSNTVLKASIDSNGLNMSSRLMGGKGADVASAADITLGIDGNYFDITGTTQIDTIVSTGWQAGSNITLQFDASVTVKHNTAGTGASLLLSGSADFSATANDTLSLVFDGTTWRETSRTVI